MDDLQIKKMEDTCLAPFKRAQVLLMEAENQMAFLGRLEPGGKSEIRLRFEKFEENVKTAWKKAFEEYGVDNIYALPISVYKQIAEDWIHKPGSELMFWLSGKAAELRLDARENPYVMAGAALGLSYNLAPEGGKDE
jgi:hypothetical protein